MLRIMKMRNLNSLLKNIFVLFSAIKDDIHYYLLRGHRLLHLHWLLGNIREGNLHGELDRVEELNHKTGNNLEARFLLTPT